MNDRECEDLLKNLEEKPKKSWAVFTVLTEEGMRRYFLDCKDPENIPPFSLKKYGEHLNIRKREISRYKKMYYKGGYFQGEKILKIRISNC